MHIPIVHKILTSISVVRKIFVVDLTCTNCNCTWKEMLTLSFQTRKRSRNSCRLNQTNTTGPEEPSPV